LVTGSIEHGLTTFPFAFDSLRLESVHDPQIPFSPERAVGGTTEATAMSEEFHRVTFRRVQCTEHPFTTSV